MRSRRHLLLRAACWLLACLVTAAGSASAQGPAYRERWGYLHLERRRAELFDELAGRSEADVRAVAELLAASDGGVPFVPVANALAFLRGCEPDAAFQLRCALGLFVLPEVVDPDGKQPACRVANFSVMLPFSLPPAGRMTFEVSISKPSGERIHVESLSDKTDLEDVRLAQARLEKLYGDKISVQVHVELDPKWEVRREKVLPDEPLMKKEEMTKDSTDGAAPSEDVAGSKSKNEKRTRRKK